MDKLDPSGNERTPTERYLLYRGDTYEDLVRSLFRTALGNGIEVGEVYNMDDYAYENDPHEPIIVRIISKN